MDVLKRCMICNRKFARYSCKKCGNLVCEDCYDAIKGVCIVCKQGKRIR